MTIDRRPEPGVEFTSERDIIFGGVKWFFTLPDEPNDPYGPYGGEELAKIAAANVLKALTR